MIKVPTTVVMVPSAYRSGAGKKASAQLGNPGHTGSILKRAGSPAKKGFDEVYLPAAATESARVRMSRGSHSGHLERYHRSNQGRVHSARIV